MSDRKPPPPTIEASLRRMFDAIDRADQQLSAFLNATVEPPSQQQRPPQQPPQPAPPPRVDPVRSVVDHVAWEINAKLERRRLRQERKLAKLRLREERRRAKALHEGHRNPVMGILMIGAAGFLAYLAMTGKPFWFVFVALGLFMGGAAQFGGNKKKALPAPDAAKTPESKEAAAVSASTEKDEAKRVDEIAKKLIRELEEGPKVLREIVQDPEKTVDGLRKGYHAIADRERKLRAPVTPEEDTRLSNERAQLLSRRDAATDEVTKARYDEALRALDLQRQERAALLTAASRLEAERTRLRYTLEGLLAQVIRARSVHGMESGNDVALRQSLERLTDEVGAVAEALESVSRPEPIAPISAPAADPVLGSPRRDRIR